MFACDLYTHIVEFGVVVESISTVGNLSVNVLGVENTLCVPARCNKHHSAVTRPLCSGLQ